LSPDEPPDALLDSPSPALPDLLAVPAPPPGSCSLHPPQHPPSIWMCCVLLCATSTGTGTHVRTHTHAYKHAHTHAHTHAPRIILTWRPSPPTRQTQLGDTLRRGPALPRSPG
jgi:hypothetical protein